MARDYANKLLRLIPAEVVALYQSAYAIIVEQTDWLAKVTLPLLPIIGLVLVIFVRVWGTRSDDGKWGSVQWGAVFVAAISFVLWVISLGHPIVWVPELPKWPGAVLLMIWVFILPYFYKSE